MSMELGRFSRLTKGANIAPVFKKDDCMDKADYRPVIDQYIAKKSFRKMFL